jgi:1,4-dihydroxy-2-naphthoate octaprenyltransferase
MGIINIGQENRTHVFFFLILFAAVLWAVFLLQRGEILQLSFVVASLAAINPVIALVEVKNPLRARSLFFFNLLVIVALLWATFLFVIGVQLWISLFLIIIAIGIPLILRITSNEDLKPTMS